MTAIRVFSVLLISACLVQTRKRTNLDDIKQQMMTFTLIQINHGASLNVQNAWRTNGSEVLARVINEYSIYGPRNRGLTYSLPYRDPISSAQSVQDGYEAMTSTNDMYCALVFQTGNQEFINAFDQCKPALSLYHNEETKAATISKLRETCQLRDRLNIYFVDPDEATQALLSLSAKLSEHVYKLVLEAATKTRELTNSQDIWDALKGAVEVEAKNYEKLHMLLTDEPTIRVKHTLATKTALFLTGQLDDDRKPLMCAVMRTIRLDWFRVAFGSVCRDFASGKILWQNLSFSYNEEYPTSIEMAHD